MTPQCNLPLGYTAGAALRIEAETRGIEAGLRTLFAMTDSDLREMGERGQSLVLRDYTWSRIAEQMARVYLWLLGAGPKPAEILAGADRSSEASRGQTRNQTVRKTVSRGMQRVRLDISPAPIKIALVLGSVLRSGGGVFTTVLRLSKSLVSSPNVSVTVLGLRDQFTLADSPLWKPVPVRTFDPIGPRKFGFCPRQKQALVQEQADLVHTHGIWMYCSWAVLSWHRLTGRPYVVSPQGMLDEWALKNSRQRKRLAWWAYEREHLAKASCIHAVSVEEASSFRRHGLRNPIAVIPNPVDLPGPPCATPPPWRATFPSGRNVMLFLGRIHPKKGVANLIRAWARCETAEAAGRKIGCWPSQAGTRKDMRPN